MESISILEKVKSNYILTSIIEYIQNNDFKYHFFRYSKSFQNKFGIEINDYKQKYLNKLDIDITKYLMVNDYGI